MSTWAKHGLRGSYLEELINRTNEIYRANNLALIQKIPTPITPVEINACRQISLAYFEKKSTVDYIGTVQGIPVCFDAKECSEDTFPLHNVHSHQMDFMRDFETQGGCSFFIIYYVNNDEMIYMPFEKMFYFFDRMKKGGRKSFAYDETKGLFRIRSKGEYLCHYIEGLSDWLNKNEDKRETLTGNISEEYKRET